MANPSDESEELARLKAENARLEALLAQSRAQGFSVGTEPDRIVSASSSPPNNSSNVGLWVGLGALGLLFLFILGTCGKSPVSTSPPDTPEPAAPVVTAKAPEPPPPPEIGSQWSYRETEEPMGGKTKTACVTSDDMVRLDFPYGTQRARFCIRRSPKYGLDTYFNLEEDGQILCNSYSRCRIQVRFDDKPAQSWPGTDAADGSSNIVFLTRSQSLVANIKASKRMRVELEYYQNGVQSVSFNTEGLKW